MAVAGVAQTIRFESATSLHEVLADCQGRRVDVEPGRQAPAPAREQRRAGIWLAGGAPVIARVKP